MTESQGKVLVIDDEPAVARLLGAFLGKAGFSATSAASAEEAEGLLAKEEFEVIVADILLPGRSGLDFLKLVREMELETPVVLVTGEPTLEGAIHAVQAGAYDFLVKPIQWGHLVHTVARGVEKNRLLREKRRLLEENRAYQRELEAQNVSLDPGAFGLHRAAPSPARNSGPHRKTHLPGPAHGRHRPRDQQPFGLCQEQSGPRP